jgi:N-acetylneuraminic acid mutarotase
MIAVRNGWISLDSVQAPAQPPGVDGSARFTADRPRPPANEDGSSVRDDDADPDSAHGQEKQPGADGFLPGFASGAITPVPVAPNPQRLPPLPMWRKAALIAGLILAGLLSLVVVQLKPADAVPISGEVAQVSGEPIPQTEAPPLADSSRWHPRASIRTARTRSAATAVNNKIYIIGGEVDRLPSNEVLIYDPKKDDWQSGAAKPTPVMNAPAIALSGVIYVPGGTMENGMASSIFEALDVTSGKWDTSLSPLPRPLTGHAAATLGDRIYVFGGRTPDGLNTESYAFDLSDDRWIVLPPMPTPRSQLAAAALSNRIYVIGGTDGQREFTTCEVFTPASTASAGGAWSSCAPMKIPRGSLGLAQVGQSLYAIGGGLNNYVGFNERYDPAANTWTTIATPSQRTNDWRNVAIASLPTEFYAIGGTTRGVPLSDNYVYEVLSNRTFLPALQGSPQQQEPTRAPE